MADTPDLGSGPERGGGSSPLSRTIFTRESDETGIYRADSAQNPAESEDARDGKMRLPVKVTHRKAEVKIYGKSASYAFYRTAHRAGGKRRVQSFSTY